MSKLNHSLQMIAGLALMLLAFALAQSGVMANHTGDADLARACGAAVGALINSHKSAATSQELAPAHGSQMTIAGIGPVER